MSKNWFFPFRFSLAGLNPEVIFVCQLIWLFTEDRRLVSSFLSILGDTQVIPFLNPRSIRRMTMLSGLLKLLLQCLSESGDLRFSPKIRQMILTRIVQRILLQVSSPELKRCMHLLTTYVAHSREHPALIKMRDFTLQFVKNSTSLDLRWFFLLSQFSEPLALQNLNHSTNPDLQFAILCREFRELFVKDNQLFLEMVKCSSYMRRKRIFFQLSKTGCFRMFQKSFRLLIRVFRDRLPRRISHFERCERIIDLFFQFMNDTQQSTWQFLSMAFAEESSQNLEVLHQELDVLTTVPFYYPRFSRAPCHTSLEIFDRIKVVFSLPNIPHSLLEISRSMSGTYYDKSWKSVWACGIHFILRLSSIIQKGDSFLNFVLHSVVNEERSSFYKYFLDLFLNADVMTGYHSQPEIVSFWIIFQNMQWKYLNLGRTVSFSELFWKFLEILEDPQFFGGIRYLCSKTFCSKQAFEAEFFQFCQIMRNSFPEEVFSEFFYPRVFILCKNCRAKIRRSRQLKKLGLCEKCVCPNQWTPHLTDDDDD